MALYILSLFFFAHIHASATVNPELICQDISIPVSVSAQNKDLSKDLNLQVLSNDGAINKMITSLGSMLTGGSYSIGATYCNPLSSVQGRRTTLQLLVHGITYTRNYWSHSTTTSVQLGQSESSWISYAASEGYPSLSIDRLCNGASSKPDGLAVCQLPLQTEIMHAIIQSARKGAIPGIGGAPFDRIVYIGHSYGSLIANDLSVQYPEVVDAYLLTGYTPKLFNGALGILTLPAYEPATVVSPSRFGDLWLEPAYLAATSKEGARTEFYRGDYDVATVEDDFASRGTVTLGEFATALLGQATAPAYRGKLLVLNGEHDVLFCQQGPAQALAGVPGNCSQEFVSAMRQNYPNVSAFKYYNVPNTGHCINKHRTAQQAFQLAHDFLADVGF